MKSINDILEKISDRTNPIVVKELRQAVQGKFLIVIVTCFLCIQLLTMGLFLIRDKSISESFNAGLNIFRVLLFNLLATCLLFVPAYTGIRLMSERADANVDLLFITTLRPRSIIWGKFLAGIVLTVLLYSACMPFMTFTYLLRGIDLPSIFILLALGFIVAAASVQCAILIGCIPANRGLKVILGVIWLVTIFVIFNGIIIFSVLLMEFGVGSQLDSWKFWRAALGVLVGGLALIGIFALLSIALISPLSVNRALPVRIFVTAVWLLTGIGAAIWSIGVNDFTPIVVWATSHILLHSIGLFIAVTEREHLGWRVLRTIPRRRLLRSLAFLFYSGAAGGVAWSSLIITLTLLFMIGWLIVFLDIGEEVEGIGALAGLGLHTFSYALGASLIRRHFLADRVTSAYTWVIALVLLGVTTTIIPLILFFLSGKWEQGWLIASPLGLLLYIDDNIDVMLFYNVAIATICAGFVGALSRPWFVRQVTGFRPLREKAASNPRTNESR